MIGEPTHPAQRLERELDRVLLRLGALGPQRLDRPRPGPAGLAGPASPAGATPADAVRPLLAWLADAAADAEGRPRRPVPVLASHALGDQVLVLVRDLQAATAPEDPVIERAARHLESLRREL